MTNGIRNKVVTAVYDLNYISERGDGLYKGLFLLTKTISNIIFPDYEYVIYTDKKTFDTHNLSEYFNQKNVTIKIQELNSEFYLGVVNPLRLEKVAQGNIWDRIHCVNNYVEVMYNKFEFLLRESESFNGNLIWIDAGLFGTSCGVAWRDYMAEIAHSQFFLQKIFEKINSYGLISLKGEQVGMNYTDREKINNLFNVDCFIVPGGLFGGTSDLVNDCFSSYKEIIEKMVENGFYTSDQEILSILLSKQPIKKFYEHDDWDDLQRGILKIMDLYDESVYNKNTVSFLETEKKVSMDFTDMSFTEVADYFGIDKGSLHENHLHSVVYEDLLSDLKSRSFNMVELGINDTRFPGKCIDFWTTIFRDIKYHGFDFTDCSHFRYDSNKVKIFQGDLSNSSDLQNMITEFGLTNNIDVLIDDCSHIAEEIINGFENLYRHIKKGGYYFVENVHAHQSKREETIQKIKNIIEKEGYEISKFELTLNQKLLIIQK